MYKAVHLITNENDEETLKKITDYIKEKYTLETKIFSNTLRIDKTHDKTLHLLLLDDKNVKEFLKDNLNSSIQIGLLPHDQCPNTISNYGICSDIYEAIDDSLNLELLSKIDLLKCNDNIALNRISIGDMHGMNRVDYNKNSKFQKFKIFYKNLKELTFRTYTLTTSKEHSIQTVASGITILEHSTIINKQSAINDELSIHDGKLNAYILAPNSLFSYIWYLIAIFFYQKISLVSLPKSLGYIKTEKLTISSDNILDYKIDNCELHQASNIELEVLKDCVSLHLGRVLLDVVSANSNNTEEKDVIKVNLLPKGELKNILINNKIPLIKKASDDDFKDLLTVLKDNSKFSATYLILMILSTLLATTGLFANSAPVIIGAMILAPLMAPIISLSMGIIRTDQFLLFKSIKTLAIGIFMALLFSSVYTLFIPLEQITAEMQGRLHPNLLDLLVAVFSGIAGAYATSKEEIAKSLAGVAIAVALVPPLSVTGIGIGLGNFDVIYGSFLLFITNLVGITLSAALTFIVLGFAPVTKAKKGVFYTSLIMAIVAIPLFLSFMKVVDRNKYLDDLNSIKTITINKEKIDLKINTIENRKDNILVNIEVISNKPLSLTTYNSIKNKLQEKTDKKIVLKVTPIFLLN
ncbi:TIGR00341 family protein [Poseidonibacter lekithochrous]|uniref:TIGR00341 family protein n=1 Tax=Poseidonibacter TaxID=2321187 RepID=UPI001C091D26|nr:MULTISPECIES: TIGR00341 family protein [Poseidonibacter]MBU3015157.1 TIGR00341 family protein [Poseidonibacter lekithochrous]MDO6828454.1 TIGR00341 family protein [Poseidonibacter sp. 1_MG-2023]